MSGADTFFPFKKGLDFTDLTLVFATNPNYTMYGTVDIVSDISNYKLIIFTRNYANSNGFAIVDCENKELLYNPSSGYNFRLYSSGNTTALQAYNNSDSVSTNWKLLLFN